MTLQIVYETLKRRLTSQGSLLLPHFFEYRRQVTRILCFTKSLDEAALALEKGANLAGGEQLVKKIEAGEVDVVSFDTVLCHVNMWEAIQPLKNVLKKQMPRLGQRELISDDVLTLVERHRKAVLFSAKGDIYEPDYASFTVPIAKLDMPDDMIRDNLEELFQGVSLTIVLRINEMLRFAVYEESLCTSRNRGTAPAELDYSDSVSKRIETLRFSLRNVSLRLMRLFSCRSTDLRRKGDPQTHSSLK